MRYLAKSGTMVSVVIGGLVLVLAGSWFIIDRGVSRVLERHALSVAEHWTGHLRRELPRIERLIRGDPADRDQIRYIRQMKATADVFRWRLFDETGTLTFDTRYFDELAAGWVLPVDAGLEERANRAGAGDSWPRAHVEEGDGETAPRYFAVAYDRVVVDGTHIGTLEVFIDQTEQRADLLGTLLSSGVFLAILTMLAFLVPVAGLFWQVRGHALADAAREHAATHDALTGLLNRYAFGEMVDRKIAREPDRPFQLLAFNIRRFRQVNEARGHDVGDEAIRRVAWRLQSEVGDRSAVCRLGSDEFALVDATRADPEDARALAEACLCHVWEPLHIKGGRLSLTLDCGIAQFPQDGTNSATLLTMADLALHAGGKEGEGRGSVRVFHPAMEIERSRRLEIERRLQRAVDEEDFRLVFQPLYRPGDGRLVGCEALLRLDCPDGDHISPAEFIPVAEETRQIIPLGWHVLRHACTIAARWPDHLFVAVNLSPVEFDKNHPVDGTRRALEVSGLAARRLEIEITENALILNPDLMALQLDEMKEMGVRLALDDFGTGYSNLSHVSKYPFDRLKIDRSFVANMSEGEPRSGHMLRIIAAIGDLLGLEVTAEGIETAAQAEEVARLGVDCVQGFYYSKPLDVDDLDRLIERSQRVEDAGAAKRTQPQPSSGG